MTDNPLPFTGGMVRILQPHIALLSVHSDTGAIERISWAGMSAAAKRDYYAARDAGLVAEVDHVTYQPRAEPHVRSDCFNRPELVLGLGAVGRMALAHGGIDKRSLRYVFERRDDVDAAWRDFSAMVHAIEAERLRRERGGDC